MNGKIFIICGPSGVGKGTVILGLLKNKKINLKMIPTYTTREAKPRDELTGHYRYISRGIFLEKLKNKVFFESNFFNSNYYGTQAADMNTVVKNNTVGLLEQDVGHALFTQKLYPNHVKIIFITSPLEVIRQRLLKRAEDTEKQIAARLILAKKELSQKNNCDYIVENLPNDQENTIQKVLEIIRSEVSIEK